MVINRSNFLPMTADPLSFIL